MRAIIFEAFGQAPAVRDVPDPACPADGVVVRVEATGLCRSDWHGWMGHDPGIPLPHVPGHELAGTIEQFELSFESGERMRGRFLVTRLDYAGDYNGERNYALSLESSGPVVSE